MHCQIFLCVLLLISLTTQEYILDVKYMWRKVNGTEKAVAAINNGLFGPLIRARAGEYITATVINHLFNEGLTMHWHGIHQIGTNDMDGVPFGTQYPIMPNHNMTYKFLADRPGTFWYHSHVEGQRHDALFGPLIIDPLTPYPFTYDEEIILLLSDWYTDNLNSQLLMLKSEPFRWVGSPQYLLVNGELNHTITVQQDKVYFVRVISASALSWYNLTIPNHNLTIVQVGESLVEPITRRSLWVNSGERYSFLLHANNPGCYRIGLSMLERAGPTGEAFLNYGGNCSTYVSGYDLERFDQNQLHSRNPVNLPRPTRNITITHRQILNVTTGGIKWTLNDISAKPTPQLVLDSYRNNELDQLTNTNIIQIKQGEVIDLYLLNQDRWDGTQEQHTMHLHGHSFWLLGTGLNSNSTRVLNEVNPVALETFTLPNKGWAVVRFVANNPGVWFYHCHVSWHIEMGMFLWFVYEPPVKPKPACRKKSKKCTKKN